MSCSSRNCQKGLVHCSALNVVIHCCAFASWGLTRPWRLTLAFSFQYGMLLYQNYRIPQQRKALLPHFSTPVVSTCANLRHAAFELLHQSAHADGSCCTSLPRGSRMSAFQRSWFPTTFHLPTLLSQQCDCLNISSAALPAPVLLHRAV